MDFHTQQHIDSGSLTGAAMRDLIPAGKNGCLTRFDYQPHPLPDRHSYEALFNAVRALSALSGRESLLIRGAFSELKLKRKTIFLRTGEFCKQAAFIVKGSMRMFALNEKGNEHIISFGLENSWMIDYESLLMNSPSKFCMELLEDSVLLVISHKNLNSLIRTVPGFARLIDQNNQRNVIAAQRRIYAAIGLSAEERLAELLCTAPDLINRFPQSMIASYLGITAETLSRIRKRVLIGIKHPAV